MASKCSNSALYQYLSSFTANIAIVASGMQYGWPSSSLPILLAEASPIHIDEDQGYWLATAPIFGIIAGSLSTTLFIDVIGRHKTILLTAIPYLISWIMIYFATSFEMLLSARLLAGISDGWGLCAVPLYIGEIAEPRIRGFLGSLVSIGLIVGMLLINIIGSFCSLKMTALISCIFPVILVATFFFMPESPYFLIVRGKKEAAKKRLQILMGRTDVDKEILRIENGIKENNSTKRNPLDLVRLVNNRKGLIIVLCLRACQEFSGDSAITFYTQNIFKEAGTSVPEEMATILFFTVEVVVTAIASMFVDRSGRRPLLIFSTFGSAVALLTEGFYFYFKICTDVDLTSFNLIPLVALIAFVICFSTGLKAIPFVLLGELFTQGVKAPAVCVADLSAAIFIILVSKFFQLTRDNFGMHVPFISYGIFCCIGLVFIIFYVPETKGKTLEEIQHFLKYNNFGNDNNNINQN